MLVTPFHLLATYVFSGANGRKGLILGGLWLVLGGLMSCVCLWGVPGRLGVAGNLIIPVVWFVPSVLLIAFRRWVLSEPLSQRWLVGLQLWRVIGAVFLIEMFRGHVAPEFAWTAGPGDVLAGVVAFAVLFAFRDRAGMPGWAVVLVAVVGMLDFLSAFFFGFTSSDGPQNLFPQETPSRMIEFPTGLIPLFLVPYAIFFHTLSLLTLRMHPAEGRD
ncbi:MAG: hypothetical protein AAGA55_00290 [Planctomycetota bacterium]